MANAILILFLCSLLISSALTTKAKGRKAKAETKSATKNYEAELKSANAILGKLFASVAKDDQVGGLKRAFGDYNPGRNPRKGLQGSQPDPHSPMVMLVTNLIRSLIGIGMKLGVDVRQEFYKAQKAPVYSAEYSALGPKTKASAVKLEAANYQTTAKPDANFNYEGNLHADRGYVNGKANQRPAKAEGEGYGNEQATGYAPPQGVVNENQQYGNPEIVKGNENYGNQGNFNGNQGYENQGSFMENQENFKGNQGYENLNENKGYENQGNFKENPGSFNGNQGYENQENKGYENQGNKGYENQGNKGYENQGNKGYENQGNLNVNKGYENQGNLNLNKGYENQGNLNVNKGYENQGNLNVNKGYENQENLNENKGYENQGNLNGNNGYENQGNLNGNKDYENQGNLNGNNGYKNQGNLNVNKGHENLGNLNGNKGYENQGILNENKGYENQENFKENQGYTNQENYKGNSEYRSQDYLIQGNLNGNQENFKGNQEYTNQGNSNGNQGNLEYENQGNSNGKEEQRNYENQKYENQPYNNGEKPRSYEGVPVYFSEPNIGSVGGEMAPIYGSNGFKDNAPIYRDAVTFPSYRDAPLAPANGGNSNEQNYKQENKFNGKTQNFAYNPETPQKASNFEFKTGDGNYGEPQNYNEKNANFGNNPAEVKGEGEYANRGISDYNIYDEEDFGTNYPAQASHLKMISLI